MSLETRSPCKVNLLLNILGKRPDGFHELETVMHPVNLFDKLSFARVDNGIHLSCNEPSLPVNSENLVYRAADAFFNAANIKAGVMIRLEKKIPLAAGLGGGSGNAAVTLQAMNELFERPLSPEQLQGLASGLGSDVPFFLTSRPALAFGRGEKIESLDFFPALKGAALLLIHPGFGVSTAWAYQQLGRFSAALNGRPGRARTLVTLLNSPDLKSASAEFFNSLESPVLEKYPLLGLFQEFLRANGATATLMSGSGSTTFALFQEGLTAAEELREKFKAKFGQSCWTAVVPI